MKVCYGAGWDTTYGWFLRSTWVCLNDPTFGFHSYGFRLYLPCRRHLP